MRTTTSKWAYETTNLELLDELIERCCKAAPAAQGLITDAGAGCDWQEAQYLRGVILSKLDGNEPPFKPDDQVICIEESVRCLDNAYLVEIDQQLTIVRIWYLGDGDWALEFKELKVREKRPKKPQFPAKCFKPLTTPT